jgi:hypothetical protein
MIMGRHGRRVPGNPNIGKILADEMARRDVPALQL